MAPLEPVERRKIRVARRLLPRTNRRRRRRTRATARRLSPHRTHRAGEAALYGVRSRALRGSPPGNVSAVGITGGVSATARSWGTREDAVGVASERPRRPRARSRRSPRTRAMNEVLSRLRSSSDPLYIRRRPSHACLFDPAGSHTGTAHVNPRRISSACSPLIDAARTPTSSENESFSVQIAPANPE